MFAIDAAPVEGRARVGCFQFSTEGDKESMTMKRILKSVLLASFASTLVATATMAADLPDEAAAPEIAPAPVSGTAYDWTGAYGGINLGLGFSGDFDNNFGADLDSSRGFIGGGVAGYNHQIDKFVLGIEADVNYSTLQAETGVTDADLNLLGTVTARFGYTPVDRVLAYAEGGYAFGRTELAVPGASDRAFANGFAVGGGLEYAITNNVLSGVEYNYVDLSEENFNVGIGNTEADFSGHVVKFNLKYKY